MENMNPLLFIISWIRFDLEVGRGLPVSLKKLEEKFPNHRLVQYLVSSDHKESQKTQAKPIKSRSAKHLKRLLRRGLEGYGVLHQLRSLESEVLQQSKSQIEKEMARLPVRCLLPVMFLMFPAFAILLIGPWIQQVIG